MNTGFTPSQANIPHPGINGVPAPSIRFGKDINAPQQGSNEDAFIRQSSEPDNSHVHHQHHHDTFATSPSNIEPSANDFDESEESSEDLAGKLVATAKPLDTTEATTPIIQKLRTQTAEQLRQVMSRNHLNSAVLMYDDERLKTGVLAQLQADMLGAPILELDCDGIDPEKNGFFDNKQIDYKFPEILAETLPQLESKARLSGNKQKPLVLVLNNLNEDELSNLQNKKVAKKLQEQFPDIRIIAPTESTDKSGDSKSFSWMDDEKESGTAPWRAGQFQIINVPTLKPQEWARVIKHEPFAQQVLNFWELDASEDVLNEFFGVLKRENQEAPLTYESLLAELDALGSFVNPEVDKPNYPLTSQHIKNYTHKVLSTRRNHLPTSGGPVSMGPAPYDLINSGDINVSMDDIVGHDKAKQILTHALKKARFPKVFNFLNEGNPDANQSMIMLMGPPGGGKTLLAKAVAAQGNATYISTSGSRFVNGLVGGGANAIRRLRDGIEQAPDDMVVLFIDELDALGSRSGMGGEMGASGSEDLKTINEFLAFTDGVKKIGNKRLLLIGATNRPEALDPAILSRFNQKVEIKELNTKQRAEVILKQMEQKNLVPDHTVDINALAKRLKDFSGRDIRNLMINVQEKLESKLAEDEEQLKHYEDNPDALKSVRLEVSHKDLMEAAREIKRSKRQIDKNSESGEYGGKPENGGRKLYTITG